MRAPTPGDLAATVAPWLGGPPVALPRGVPALLSLAERHGLVAMLPDDPELVGPRVAVRAETVARYLRALADLAAVREAFDAADVRWVAVKGPVVAARLYPRPDLRPFSDVDVLVEPSRFGDALAAVESLGGRCPVRNWPRMVELGLAELPVLLPAGSVLALHWHAVHRARARRTWRLDTARLLERAVPAAELDGTPTLDAVATLVHLAWHSTKSGGARLLWACDVELAAARLPATGPGEVRALCRQTRTTLAVAVALDWAAAAFPGGAAAGLAEQFPRSPWRSLTRAARRQQLARKPGRRSGQALPRATRATTAGSLLALVDGVVRPGAGRAQGSIADVATGGPDRAEYLARVATGRL